MKRKNTKLLVEEWKRVLSEGLYDSDPEVLEEGWKENLAIGLTVIGLGLGTLKPAEAKSSSGSSGQMMKILDKSGGFVKKDSIYKNQGETKEEFDRVYKKCFFQAFKISKDDASFQEKIKKMIEIPPLAGQITVDEAKSIVMNAFSKALDSHCDQIYNDIGKPLIDKIGKKLKSGKKVEFSKDDTKDLGISYTVDHLDTKGVAKTFMKMIKREIIKQTNDKSSLLEKIMKDTTKNFREAMKKKSPDDLPTDSMSDAISNFFGM